MRGATVTFTQLRTFALVAELGSLRAAAAAPGVSEPAGSAAVTALRADLGDPLFRRTGTGIALTPGGRALATRARELVRLADRTRREVASATSAGRLRVLATAACAEQVAGAVVAAFVRRVPRVDVDLSVGSPECAAGALGDDSADIALGIRPPAAPGQVLESVPFLRYQRVLVAAPGHPLVGAGRLSPAHLGHHSWLGGPGGREAGGGAVVAGRPGPPLLAGRAGGDRAGQRGGGLGPRLRASPGRRAVRERGAGPGPRASGRGAVARARPRRPR